MNNQDNSTNNRGKRTKMRIIDAAEALFAMQGIKATTVRDIAAEADCELGSISYHFTNKETLWHSVLERRVSAACSMISDSLNTAMSQKNKPLGVEAILQCYVDPILQPLRMADQGWLNYCQLVSQQIIIETSKPLHPVITQHYLPVRELYLKALKAALPSTQPEQVAWCFSVFENTLSSTMFGHTKTKRSQQTALEQTRTNLVPFFAAGFHTIGNK